MPGNDLSGQNIATPQPDEADANKSKSKTSESDGPQVEMSHENQGSTDSAEPSQGSHVDSGSQRPPSYMNPDKLIKCQWYQGRRLFKCSFNDGRKSAWYWEKDLDPERVSQRLQSHTLKGKKKKRSRTKIFVPLKQAEDV